MIRYVLVHGAWEGAWSWEDVVPALEARGHEVENVDLPGSHSNPASIADVTTDAQVAAVAAALAGSHDKVVLAGHSLGGTVISQFAERFPERVERLVYVTAFLTASGVSALETMQSDPEGQLLPKVGFADDQSYATVAEDVWREVGFHDASHAAIEAALPRLAPRQSAATFTSTRALTAERFGSVPKTYLRASIDRVLTPTLQDRMIASWPVDKVVTLEAGHFPALSVPAELAKALLDAAP